MSEKPSVRSDDPNLDLIRAVAVMCVFFAHLWQTVIGHNDIVRQYAQIAVPIFFVHTTLVLMMSLDRTREQGRALIANFFVRRWFRIYPLAIVCATGAMIAVPSTSWFVYLTNVSLTQNLFYQPDMLRGWWTLPLEVQMYLWLPFLFLWLRRAPIRSTFVVWAIGLALAIAQPYISGRLNVLAFLPCFLSGIVAWRISRDYRPFISGKWWPLAFAATWVVWISTSANLTLFPRWLFCFVLGLAIPWFREMSFRPVNVVANRIATYSYSIYLSHFVIIDFVFQTLRDLSPWLQWPLFVVLAVTVPIVMFHTIERPGIALGRRLAQRVISRPARTPAPAPAAVFADSAS